MSEPEKFQPRSPESAGESKPPRTRQYMAACEGVQVVRVDVGPGERSLAEADGNGMKEILEEVLYAFLRTHQDLLGKVPIGRFESSKYVFLMTFDEGPVTIEEDGGPKALDLG